METECGNGHTLNETLKEPNTSQVACVRCHDPHGVVAAGTAGGLALVRGW